MTKVELLAKKLNQQIKDTEEIKQFKHYEALLHNNEELVLMEKQIKDLQKQIVHQKSNNDDTVVETIEKYQVLKEQFETHPLVVNYIYHLEEANMLLQTINQQINGGLK